MIDEYMRGRENLLDELLDNDVVEDVARRFIELGDNWTWAGLPEDSKESCRDITRDYLRCVKDHFNYA